jgi:hypothetical protein
MTEYDRLVEQADQELALNGCVSPFTQLQLQAAANGEPIPHIDVGAIFKNVRAGRQDPEDVWID